MPKPCSCGGSNENCMHCYGRGFIGGSGQGYNVGGHGAGRAIRRGKRNKKSARPVKTSSATKVLSCPLCNFKGPTLALAHHYEICRERKQGEVCCLTCHKVIEGSEAEQHLANAHTSTAHSSTTGHGASPQSRKLTACSICGSRVRHDRIGRHKRRVHRLALQRSKRKTAIPETAGVELTPLEKWKAQKQAGQSPFQPNLDATKPYAHAYREHGKFGSHPSHDGFDDESGA